MLGPLTQTCPHCSQAAGFAEIRCPGCQASLLYGLVASPVADAAIQDRAAAVLAAVPGGPAPNEARRRLREGLPLIVGLSRQRTEQVQGRLIDLGLLPRLGPAPRGTAPLEADGAESGLGRRVAVALAVPVVAFALFWLFEPGTPPGAEPDAAVAAGAGAAVTPEDAGPRFDLSAGIQRSRRGLVLVCQARARATGALPGGNLTLRLRDESGTVIWTHQVSERGALIQQTTVGGEPGAQKTVDLRDDLRELFLRGGERLTLEGDWQGWHGGPIPIDVPERPSPVG